MGYDREANFGVGYSKMTEFLQWLSYKMYVLTGLQKPQRPLTLEQNRKPLLVIGDPGIGKTAGIIALREKIYRELSAKPPKSNGEVLDARKMLADLMAQGTPENEAKYAVLNIFNQKRAELRQQGKTEAEVEMAIAAMKPDRIGFKKIQLGQTTIGELSGILVAFQKTGTVKREYPNDLPTDLDEKYGILFLDEITSASTEQIQPALGFADDSRSIGGYKLPPHWVVVAAGNGPGSANFNTFDDMALSRFRTFEIKYDYKEDWRSWAVAHGISSSIVAFLDFYPSEVIHIQSDDMSEHGNGSANPRTWELLSGALAEAEAYGCPVTADRMFDFASKVIGVETGRKFGAFVLCCSNLSVKPEDILSGKIKTVDDLDKYKNEATLKSKDLSGVSAALSGKEGLFSMLLNGVITQLEKEAQQNEGAIFTPKNKLTDFGKRIVNTVGWICSAEDKFLDKAISGIVMLTLRIPNIADFLNADEGGDACPKFEEFVANHAEVINAINSKGMLG